MFSGPGGLNPETAQTAAQLAPAAAIAAAHPELEAGKLQNKAMELAEVAAPIAVGMHLHPPQPGVQCGATV